MSNYTRSQAFPIRAGARDSGFVAEFRAVVGLRHGNNVSYIAAFVAGIFSITSPCVLPIVPLVCGASLRNARRDDQRSHLPPPDSANAFAYILGFSGGFISLGIALGCRRVLGSAASCSHRTAPGSSGPARLSRALGFSKSGSSRSPGCGRNAVSPRPARGGCLVALRRFWSVSPLGPVGRPARDRFWARF